MTRIEAKVRKIRTGEQGTKKQMNKEKGRKMG